jgi:dTDP-4-dehydrorhamnose 3,5-epimerase
MQAVAAEFSSYAGVLWNDPDLGIKWPVDEAAIVLSEKDRTLPRLRDLPEFFVYKAGE